MIRGLYVDRPLHVTFREEPCPMLQAGDLCIRSEFASIKHGTDFHIFSGQSPFEDRRFDPELRLFVPKEPMGQPAEALNRSIGNMVVGSVARAGEGVTRFAPGDRVFCYGPVCDYVIRNEAQVEPLLPPMTAPDAVCLDPALYAYAAIRDAKPSVGDNVVVFGLGAIGIFVVQLFKLSGCLNIIAVDTIAKRRRLAEQYGATQVLDPALCDVAMEIRGRLGQGADLAIEASGHYKALAEAMRAVQKCARIVTLGYYKGKGVDLELGAEWLHNRLELICSMPVWDNPSREYPIWDRQRMERTLVTLFCEKQLRSQGILDPVVDFADSDQAFMRIYHDPSDAIKLGIRFPA